jgi:ribose/xylose/arabinose/galactoside ABC-type transport system permease subunit
MSGSLSGVIPAPVATDPVPPQEPAGQQASRGQLSRAARILATPLAFVLILLPGFGGWLGTSFLTVDARLFDVHQNAPVLFISLGLVLIMASGHFDLSVASLATLVSILSLGLSVKQELPFWLVALICLGVSVAAGLLNGFLVTVVHLNAFIATLGSGALFAGVSAVYTGGQHISPAGKENGPPDWFVGLNSIGSYLRTVPSWLTWLLVIALGVAAVFVLLELSSRSSRALRYGGSAAIAGGVAALGLLLSGKSSWTITLLLAAGLLLWAGMRYTVAGRSLYAVGGNETAARLAGINVRRHVMGAFVGTSVFAGIGGMALASTQGSAAPGLGDAFLLPAYAAIFLGAVMFADHRYHVWGTLVGGICIVWVAQGLITGGVAYTWMEFINGSVLIAAVAVSSLTRGRRK